MEATGERVVSGVRLSAVAERDELLDFIQNTDRVAAEAAAQRLRWVDRFRVEFEDASGGSLAADPGGIRSRSLRAELATALRIPESSAEAMIARARILVHTLPATLRRLGKGRIGERHAAVLADAVAGLPAAQAAGFERPAPGRRHPAAARTGRPCVSRACPGGSGRRCRWRCRC